MPYEDSRSENTLWSWIGLATVALLLVAFAFAAFSPLISSAGAVDLVAARDDGSGDVGAAEDEDDDEDDLDDTSFDEISLDGDSADNSLNGASGDDSLNGGGGEDDLSGGAGDDTLSGGAGDDSLDGDGGDDNIDGDGGDDSIDGGGGNDTLVGGPGNDDVSGDAGADLINVRGEGADKVSCGSARDVVKASDNDRVAANCEVVR